LAAAWLDGLRRNHKLHAGYNRHVYHRPGVSDGTDSSVYDSVMVSATANLPPTAVALASATSGLAALSVNFDAGGSSDPETGPLTFVWDFGDPASGGPTPATW